MTKKAGFVRVELTDIEARICVRWLLLFAGKASKSKALLSGHESGEEKTKTLIRALLKASRYKRTHVEIQKNLTKHVVVLRDVGILNGVFVSTTFEEFAKRCAESQDGPGRPRLTKAQVKMWVEQKNGDIRELRRLRKRERLDQWLDEIQARGESILIATTPPP